MLSRRNIRVKVMQTLYLLDSGTQDLKLEEALKTLEEKFEQSRKLFTFLTYYIVEVARFAETDAVQKAGKHLPTASDLSVNTKISGNTLLWQIREDASFIKVADNFGIPNIIDSESLKKTYNKLKESVEYIDYIEFQERNKKSERKILEFIFTDMMLPDENFINYMEEHFINWDDDAELMHSIMMSYLSKPVPTIFESILSDEKREFGKSLLRTVLEKKETTLELIKPKLKNWDAERIAALDLIILQMGVCEFLFFETIPTKVTINEYIDLAKDYSTVQSGQFVNGLLDNIHKELSNENKIVKKVYKNSTI